MKISTKGHYGLRIMLELSLYYDKKLLTVREISEKQGISEKYIEQIIGTLNKAGLVRSQRGAAGGYKLSESPQLTTIGQILRVTESGLNIIDCMKEHTPQCKMSDKCVMINVWRQMKCAMENVVDNISLADLVTQYNENFNFSYMI